MLAAAAVGFCALGLYLGAWTLFVTGSACATAAGGVCNGAPIAMAVVGLPVLYAAWAVGLALTGARLAGLAPLAIGLALFALARATDYHETPTLIWLLSAALLSAGWRLWVRSER